MGSRSVPEKLTVKSRNTPVVNNKLLDLVDDKLVEYVDSLSHPKKRRRNLTINEANGLKWCRQQVKKRNLYITKADKGGATIVLKADRVHNIILKSLVDITKFSKLKSDPRNTIKSELNALIEHFVEEGLLTSHERFAITGKTEKGGMSHSHDFCMSSPYTYPLFKIHKLSLQEVENKVIPPTRMVTSGIGGPTYRLGVFVENLLKPVVEKYCKNELIKDTTEFISEVEKLNKNNTPRTVSNLATLDVDALYPNIKRDLALVALREALEYCSDYSASFIDLIIVLSDFCLRNSIIEYRDQWYRSEEGVPTGGTESGPIANIYVKWGLDCILLPHKSIQRLNKILTRKRFLDDLWILWKGSSRQFEQFLTAMNKVGKDIGLTFKGCSSKKVEFLDTLTTLIGSRIETDLFIKPTDAQQFLNRRSDHPEHMFKSIPYSQMRRTVVICSNPEQRTCAIEHMSRKFIRSGYSTNEIQKAREKIKTLNRDDVLMRREPRVANETEKLLTFVISHNIFFKKQLNNFISSNIDDFKTLIGDETKIMVVERRNMNTASLLFKKSSFSKNEKEEKPSQKCSKRNCKCCEIMSLDKIMTIRGKRIPLDFRLDCSSANVIYLAVCIHCDINVGFYFGQTITPVNTRFNGHRHHFNELDYKKSALAYHIHDKHYTHFKQKLKNFKLGVVKECTPQNLDRAENYYVNLTEADIRGLNRYKVMK